MKFCVRFKRGEYIHWYLKVSRENPGSYWYGQSTDRAVFNTEAEARAAWKQFVMAEKREMPAAFQDWWNNAFVVPITEHGDGSPTPV
jgi:hypothetical protein